MNEIDKLYNRMITIYNHILEKEPNPITKMMIEDVEKAYKKKKLSDLRKMNKEMDKFIRYGLSKKDQKEVYILLGENKEVADNTEEKEINTIISRKRIENEDEYELIKETVDELAQQDVPDQEKIDLLDQLMSDFENNIES
ncbi:MAG: hypothetical protein GY756_27850 [bacterium]|nr:hypothetical protein [bacterium]